MKAIVIGGGASGMFCAGLLGQKGVECVLLEKNDKLGKKLFITGKGRCNLTNNADRQTLLDNVVTNSKFLIAALSKFTPSDLMSFVEGRNLPLKVERGDRVFPLSDKSSDVIRCFSDFLDENNVKVLLETKVEKIIAKDNKICGVQLENGTQLFADIVVVATGGKSYSSTGSDGDGYKFALSVGHTVQELRPALVPFILAEQRDLAGLSLKNVGVSAQDINKKTLCDDFGEMLFTHNGVSGPTVLSMSSKINKYCHNGKFDRRLFFVIDLKPALSESVLDARLQREFGANLNCEVKNIMPSLLPKSLIPYILDQAKVSPEKKCNVVTKEERLRLVQTLKNFSSEIARLDKLEFGIVTNGGVTVKEINPADMQSKIISGLYFVGETLDVDALTGGFNLQIAFSTAFSMANSIK
ncbi:MAG: aminoacetone oxidase family FAD-binding enzyme [Clostridia bacterium]